MHHDDVMTLPDDIAAYDNTQVGADREICEALSAQIARDLPDAESKVWHGPPVWFFAGIPGAGYSVRKSGVQLLFWSGQSFGEEGLDDEGTFKAAQKIYVDASEIDADDLTRWLGKARDIQWDYKNIRSRRGVLEPIPPFTGDAS